MLGASGVARSSTGVGVVYLPLVVNLPPTPTPTPTPTPAPLTWTPRASLPSWLSANGGAVVVNGRIYDGALDSLDGLIHAVTYDPAADTWTLRPGAAPGPICCGPAVVAAATNGKIYVIAGTYGQSPTTLEYDPGSDAWSTRGPLPSPVSKLGWVGANDGKVYAIGGSDTSGNAVSSVQIYDPGKNSWSSGPTMPSAIALPSVAVATDGRIYVFGNGVVDAYDTATGQWSTLQPVAPVRTGMGAAQAGDGKIYLAGGSICACGLALPPRDVRVFDPSTGSWAISTSLLWGEQSPSVVVLNGTDVYVIGGWNGEAYDPRVEEATIP